MELKDGKYKVHKHLDGKDTVLGRFEIKNNSIVFLSEVDKMNIDQFPAGPMNEHTIKRIKYLITNPDKHTYIKKV